MPKFITFTALLPQQAGGGTIKVDINPERVDNVQTILVAGELKDSQGQPIAKPHTGMSQGQHMYVVDMKRDEVLRILEGTDDGEDSPQPK